jgi:hypothetical protein
MELQSGPIPGTAQWSCDSLVHKALILAKFNLR